jgi:hypothetical protein
MSEFINNQSLRKEKLKEALRQIHEGRPQEEVKAVFAEILSQATAGEIAEIEQALIAEGLPVEDIQYLCDVHVAMFRQSLDQQEPPEMKPGHPIYTFRAENELSNLALENAKASLANYKDDPTPEKRKTLTESIRKLKEFDRHYERKENLLFPYLEKYGFSGPSNVMWGIHDDIRKAWKQILANLESDRPDSRELGVELEKVFTVMATAIHEMFYKEDRILFPNALERLSDQDWLALHSQEDEFGFSFATRGSEWPEGNVQKPSNEVKIKETTDEERNPVMSDFPLTHGDLSISQIDMMLKSLPVDITFVDENDTVCYYSETPERVFKRTPAIIGRKVQNCHPPASVDKVMEIVEDFRAGKRDVAEFWIEMGGKFIHIRYFPMHDAKGNYRGTLEVSQEVTGIRKLEGEKRLLDA